MKVARLPRAVTANPKLVASVPTDLLTLLCLNSFARFTLITMAFMVCARYGTRFTVKESLSAESRLPD